LIYAMAEKQKKGNVIFEKVVMIALFAQFANEL
jgi:hypothetical protein